MAACRVRCAETVRTLLAAGADAAKADSAGVTAHGYAADSPAIIALLDGAAPGKHAGEEADPFYCSICAGTISEERGGPCTALCGVHNFDAACLQRFIRYELAAQRAPLCPTCRLP
jgi:hypothetical protein